MRRTKIVCTLGPATSSVAVIKKLLRAGMNVARLNLSHGSHREHAATIDAARRAAQEEKKNLALLLDTRGPEIRIGTFAGQKAVLREGSRFTLTTEEIAGTAERVSVNYRGLPRDVAPGMQILLDDGLIVLEVLEVTGTEIHCLVVTGGELTDRKGVNVPAARLNLPAVTSKDREDIIFAVKNDLDYIAASFTRKAEDILAVRAILEEYRSDIHIIAKIENREGMENLDSVLAVADGVMVARGDLGVEVPAEDVPLLQKQMIRKCNEAGKPVITATQMLESMIRNPRPTRAEASDVANAIFDGTDAVMLSGETAVGKYPVEAVRTMARIAERTETALEYEKMLEIFNPPEERSVTDAIAYATCHVAQELNAAAVITATQSGFTARIISKYKPKARIIAVTPRQNVARRLALSWGVYPLLSRPTATTDEMFAAAVESALASGYIQNGDLVVITAGVPVGISGTTNVLRVHTAGEILVKGTGLGKKAVSGRVRIARTAAEAAAVTAGEILVTPATDRDYVPYLEKAAGIVAEEGGLTSHAAVVALHLGIPVIVGAAGAVSFLREGELITMDTVRGLVYRGKATIL
ncbi:MAG TPA: pyruvate kinase [Firmicutes bacterium]|nr:pyruvate kinase [Bacillota bacterium]